MKKNLKRTLAKVMAVALTVAMAGTAAPDADAAKKIKLSKSSITVTKGKTKKVTIKNVTKNKVKSLKVKSSKTKVATAKASGKTAVKVTGKKKGSAKVTVTVNVKGQKKATKLTLKVKVTNPSIPTPSDTPATTAPATSAPATSAPATTTPPAGGNQTQTPGGSQTTPPASSQTTPPAGTTDPDTKEALKLDLIPANRTSFIKENYYADLVFYEENAYSFKSISQYNTGMGINVAADGSPVDVSSYKYLKVVVDCPAEVSLNLYDSSATNYYSKVDNYEGQVSMTPDKKSGLRVIYVPLVDPDNANNKWTEGADLEEIVSVSINPNNALGESITVYSIEFTDDYVENETPSVPEELTAIETPAPSESPAPSTTPDTPSGSGVGGEESPAPSGSPAPSTTPAQNETPEVEVDLSAATGQGYGANPTVSGASKTSVTVTADDYNQGIKVSVTIPKGFDISDYYGISMDIAVDSNSENAFSYKKLTVALQDKDEQYLQGAGASVNVDILSKSNISIAKGATESIVEAFDFSNIEEAKTTEGTFDIVIGMSVDKGSAVTYTISNVKLLASEPTDDEEE